MSLKITLKPHERIILGGAVVTNGNCGAVLSIANTVPILREKDIMREEEATSFCRKIYFVIQLMYVDEKNMVQHHDVYWQLVRELVAAVPTMGHYVSEMSENIINNRFYQALKIARKMIDYEEELLDYAANCH